MHFVIMGSGAIGGYFGARLAQSGEKVTFIARNQHFKAIKKSGLKLESIVGNVHLIDVNVVESTITIKNVDVIFLAVKSFQLPTALEQIKTIITPNTRIIPLLNGINTLETMKLSGIASENIYGGLAKIISQVKSPGTISHTGAKPHITLGLTHVYDKTDQVNELARLKSIANCLKNADISTGVTKNIDTALWRKFIFVGAWGALASVIRKPIGILLNNHDSHQLLVNIVNEYAEIANAKELLLTKEMIEETLTFIGDLPEHSETSMQKDIFNGVDSEFLALVAYPKKLAEKYHIKSPTLDFCYACLSAQLGYSTNNA